MFIALVLKVERPQQIKDFRPISLCNSTYKIISKTMVGRLKPIKGPGGRIPKRFYSKKANDI